MSKRPLTPVYILFFILFSPDTWRIIAGVVFAWILTPLVVRPDMGSMAVGMLGVMLTCIGYVLFAWPAKKVSRILQKLILKDRLK